ncbi:MAG TPA: DNA repair protein RecO [Gemmatimonadales bacterium]|nr:DNA repair protein RecO [Gemmatimonadales bacterium]
MPLVQTPAIVLSYVRYGETSKIVRFATRDLGVQSAIAKGALRPRSRFGAALQLLSGGQAHLLMRENRELHILTAFDLQHLRVGLATQLPRYTAAAALAEVMLRFAPPDPHPETFELFQAALDSLEVAPPAEVPVLGLRLLWLLISALGFAPALQICARDGAPINPEGPLPFNIREGGALCAGCAALLGANRLPPEARVDLERLLDGQASLPGLDARHLAAHQRLLAGYIRCHLAESTALPALDFWLRRAPG